jgi:protein-tyrosine phosphatase
MNNEIKAQENNKLSAEKIRIERDKTTKKASLHVAVDCAWKLFGGTSIETINLTIPIAEGQGSGVFPLNNIEDSVRYYFQLITLTDTILVSDTHLPMAGGFNFRDIGGIKTADGHFVQWGKLFRSDDLHTLTDEDLSYLSSIPITSIVDFRSDSEINKAPDKNPASVKQNYPFSITPGNLMEVLKIENFDVSYLDGFMIEMNELLVTDSTYIDQYKKFFSLIQNSQDIPLLYHCSAGKDRTGMATALVLFALGVDEKTIYENYLASNLFLADKYNKYIALKPNLKPLFEVKVEYLKAGIEKIRKDHQTIENYLVAILNVDIVKLKQMYLYKP